MPDTQSLKILFVHNPKSGGKRKTGKRWLGNKSNWEIGIRQHLKHTPHKYEIYNINSSVDKQSVRYWIEKIKPDRLVAVGGGWHCKACGRSGRRFGCSYLHLSGRVGKWHG